MQITFISMTLGLMQSLAKVGNTYVMQVVDYLKLKTNVLYTVAIEIMSKTVLPI